jgi:hypothetical protein
MCHYINYKIIYVTPPQKKRGYKKNGKITYNKLHNLSSSPNTVRKTEGWTEHVPSMETENFAHGTSR